jgi:hypothetical protein
MTVTAGSELAAHAGPRGWLWLVALGVVLGSTLLVHAASRMFRALPQEARSRVAADVRNHPRLLGSAAFIAGWTVVYAFYCVAFPHFFLTTTAAMSGPAGTTAVSPAPAADLGAGQPPSLSVGPSAGAPVVPVASVASVAPQQAAASYSRTGGAASSSSPTASTTASPSPTPSCTVSPVSDEVRQVQIEVEALTGQRLPADVAGVINQRACGGATSAAGRLTAPLEALLAVPSADGLLPRARTTDDVRATGQRYCGDLLAQLLAARYAAPLLHLDTTWLSSITSGVFIFCQQAQWESP